MPARLKHPRYNHPPWWYQVLGSVSEIAMPLRRSVLLAASFLCLAVSADAAFAATNPTTKECSAEWAKMKADNKVPTGLTWPKFLSQCAKDAAASGDQGATEQPAAPAAKPATKTASAKSVAKSDAIDESDSTGSAADKKACDAKWGTYKASKGVHGWKAYFTFMAGCLP